MDKKKVFSVVGALVVGALGSGLWEIGKPLIAGLWDFLLTISTLGIESLRDGIYADAARLGGTAARIIGFFQVLAATLLLLVAGLHRAIYLLWQTRPDSSSVIWGIVFPLVLLVPSAGLGVKSMRMMYVAQTATYFTQLHTIAVPYLDQHQQQQISSEAHAQPRGQNMWQRSKNCVR